MKIRSSLVSIVMSLVFSVILFPAMIGSPCLAGEESTEEVTLETSIKSASIYRGEVQIRRSGSVDVTVGVIKLVCRDLPEGFDESSLKIEGTGSAVARIIGIDLKRKKKTEIDEPRYKKLLAEYKKLDGEYSSMRIIREAINNRKSITQAIGKYKQSDGREEFARQAFAPDEWKKVLDFLESEELSVEGRLKKVSREMKKTYDEMIYVHSELEAMRSSGGKGKSVMIDCEVKKGGTLDIDINYLVKGAEWNPEYTVRYLVARGEVELTYNAQISQATGEDWKDVSVLLSTAKPHSGAAPPELAPQYLGSNQGVISGTVTSASTGRPMAYANVVLKGTKQGAMTQKNGSYAIYSVRAGKHTVRVMMMGYRIEESQVRVRGGQTTTVNFRLTEEIVGMTQEILVEAQARQIQVRDSDVGYRTTYDQVQSSGPVYGGATTHPGSKPAVPRKAPVPIPIPQAEADVVRTGFAANLQIRKAVDIETGAEPRRVLVTRKILAGQFSLYAAPRLSKDVFVKGNLTNTLDIPLLAGSSEIYAETTPEAGGNRVSDFVGREWIKPVASGEDFVIHLGVDQDVKVQHELVKKEYLTKQGKKEMKIRYSWLISIENFKKEKVVVELADRLPVPLIKEIKLDNVEIEPVPESREENGILSWKISVAPGGKQEISISYVVKYPGVLSEEDINLME